MAEILSVDTCFLTNLEREQRKRIAGPAHSFLKEHPDAEFRLSAVAFGEFAAGFDRQDHPRLDLIRAGYEFMPADEQTALSYARLYRDLRERNCLIGANDLWIVRIMRCAMICRWSPAISRSSNECPVCG